MTPYILAVTPSISKEAGSYGGGPGQIQVEHPVASSDEIVMRKTGRCLYTYHSFACDP
jgi:hypothetical protein